MNLLKTPEQDFTDIEQRLRTTYAHVTNEFGSGCQDPPLVSVGAVDHDKVKPRRFGVWTPRIATLGAVAGLAFAGLNLANRSPTTTLATASPSAFKSFPHLIPTAPAGYRLGAVSRVLTRQIPGYQTVYRASPGRLPLSLVVGGTSLMSMPVNYDTRVVSGKTVLITRGAAIIVEVIDKRCGTIAITGIDRAEITETIKHLRCRKSGVELRAELSSKRRSDLVFSGRYQVSYATLQFHFGNVREPDYFEITVEPCRCEQVIFGPDQSAETREVDGRPVLVAPGRAPDGTLLQRKAVIWAPTSTAMVRLDSPVDWNWTQIETVIRSVQEVDQATFTALLESNSVKEVSLLP
jgi:hypothetical protein